MNIYLRLRDCDLFKYLEDAELELVLPLCQPHVMQPGAWLEPRETAAILILEHGKLERVSPQGRVLGEMSVGEIDLEAGLFSTESLPYRLFAATEVQFLLFPYSALEAGWPPQINAKLQAAINDSLCLKTVHLTHLEPIDDSDA